MKPFLKVILWICWIIVFSLIVTLLTETFTRDDVITLVFIIISFIWKILGWLRKNIYVIIAVAIIAFFWWIKENIKNLRDKSVKDDQRYYDDVRENVHMEERIANDLKEIRERLEKLEKKSKSNKK